MDLDTNTLAIILIILLIVVLLLAFPGRAYYRRRWPR